MIKIPTYSNYFTLLAFAMWAAATSNWLALSAYALSTGLFYMYLESCKRRAKSMELLERLTEQLKKSTQMLYVAEDLIKKAYPKEDKNG